MGTQGAKLGIVDFYITIKVRSLQLKWFVTTWFVNIYLNIYQKFLRFQKFHCIILKIFIHYKTCLTAIVEYRIWASPANLF